MEVETNEKEENKNEEEVESLNNSVHIENPERVELLMFQILKSYDKSFLSYSLLAIWFGQDLNAPRSFTK